MQEPPALRITFTDFNDFSEVTAVKRKGARLLEGIVLLALTVLLFLFPGQSSQAAQKGVTLCLDLLIPSLFPFFVLSSLFIATGMAGTCARLVQRPMSLLFGVGGAGTSAFILGAVGGYPVGPRTLAQLTERKECTRKDARRLALFCNNCGPAFFIGAAGVGIFGSKEAGFLLLACNLLSSIFIGCSLHIFFDRNSGKANILYRNQQAASLSSVLPDCVRSSFVSTLNVCAYVILFSVITALADCSGLLPFLVNVLTALLPGEHTAALCRSFLIGFLEISTGTASLSEGVSSPAALPLAAFLLGWGGLSVHCQSLSFLQKAGVSVKLYLTAKLVQGVLAALLTAWGTALFPLSLPVMAPTNSFAAPSLVGRELLALWFLAGVYFLLNYKKR